MLTVITVKVSYFNFGIMEGITGPIVPLAFAGSNQLPKPGSKPGASAPNRFYMYGVIARLAMVKTRLKGPEGARLRPAGGGAGSGSAAGPASRRAGGRSRP